MAAAANAASGASPLGRSRRLEKVSREMSKVLRHTAAPGTMDASGWMTLAALQQQMRTSPSEQEIRDVVASNDKSRFVLDDSSSPARIRAAQGHTLQLAEPVLRPVSSAEEVGVAVHVTSSEGWAAIQESGELRRMSRTHIHFATSPHLLRTNKWATVLLLLDLQAALAAGHQFWLSDNQVLLCPGPLPVAFVRQVKAQDVPQEWQGRGV